jgi:hypothetical protein
LKLLDTDTGASILNKYAQQYIPIESVLFKIKNDSVVYLKQNDKEATYLVYVPQMMVRLTELAERKDL